MKRGIEVENAEQLAALLVGHGQGGAPDTVVEPDMHDDADEITEVESETLASESLQARDLDQQLPTSWNAKRSTFRPARPAT